MSMSRVLVVDDEEGMLEVCSDTLAALPGDPGRGRTEEHPRCSAPVPETLRSARHGHPDARHRRCRAPASRPGARPVVAGGDPDGLPDRRDGGGDDEAGSSGLSQQAIPAGRAVEAGAQAASGTAAARRKPTAGAPGRAHPPVRRDRRQKRGHAEGVRPDPARRSHRRRRACARRDGDGQGARRPQPAWQKSAQRQALRTGGLRSHP